MSKISEQVQTLRDVAGAYKHNGLSLILREAADTIESLSAKLDAANKEIENLNAIKEVAEEIAENMKWIPCKDRLPTMEECKKNDCHFILDDGNRQYEGIFDYE